MLFGGFRFGSRAGSAPAVHLPTDIAAAVTVEITATLPSSGATADISERAGFQAVASLAPQTTIGADVTVTIAASTGIAPPNLRTQVEEATITLSATMRASGTTPPVVLLAAGTGSLTFGAGLCPGFWVDILPGALTFDLSLDSGSTIAFAAQTIPVGGGNYTIPSGAYAGMIITFPAGTYNADNLYEGAVATMRSSEGNLYTFSQATTAAQPVFRHALSTPDGKAALEGRGAQFMRCVDSAVYNILQNDPAFTLAYRVAYRVNDVNGTVCGVGGAGLNGKRRFGQSNNTGGRELHTATNDAGTNFNSFSTADNTSTTVANVQWDSAGSNSPIFCRVNGGANQAPATALNIGTLTPTKFSLFVQDDNVPDTFFDGLLYDLILYNTQKSGSELSNILTALTNGT